MIVLPALDTTVPAEWAYLAEGGANVVLSHAPDSTESDSPYGGKVLRLRKRLIGGTRLGGPTEADVEFSRHVIAPLLSRHAVTLERVACTRAWLGALATVLKDRKCRPCDRRARDEIDLEAASAVVAEDLVSGPGVVAFEIKPKWGFLPRREYLSRSTRAIKSEYCRFCLHRYYRTRSLAGHDGGYCPLDLYSTDEVRIRAAVDALFSLWNDTRGEANNFRIFADGRTVRPDDAHTIARVVRHAASFSNEFSIGSDTDLRSIVLDLVVPVVVNSPLLSTLSRLQSSLDLFDVEGLASLVSSECNFDLTDPAADLSCLGSEPSVEEWTRLVSKLESDPDPDSVSTNRRFDVRERILLFLLSATFKDCSIVVRFAPGAHGGEVETTVKAIDLDPKPLGKLGKWFELDQAIVAAWREMLENSSPDQVSRVRKCSK